MNHLLKIIRNIPLRFFRESNRQSQMIRIIFLRIIFLNIVSSSYSSLIGRIMIFSYYFIQIQIYLGISNLLFFIFLSMREIIFSIRLKIQKSL